MTERLFFSGLKRYAEQGVIRFHTPGHRGGRWTTAEWRHGVGHEALSIDVSDVLASDVTGVGWNEAIEAAERRAARLFQSSSTHFLTNGTSGGLHAALYALGQDATVVAARASHLSVYAGLEFARAKPVYVPSPYDREWDIIAPPSAGQVALHARAHDASTIVCTYPDYYGLAIDLDELRRALDHRYLIVDEAHGSHFEFCPQSPMPALRAGCAVSVQSAHKTLGSMTQSSWLHIGRLSAEGVRRIRQSLSLFQSTSPSPLLLGSLEAAVDHLERRETSSDWEHAVSLTSDLRDRINRETAFWALTPKDALDRFGASLDPLRLVINVGIGGWTGLQAMQVIREKWNIQLEMSNQRTIVALISPGNSRGECDRLLKALKALSGKRPERRPAIIEPPPIPQRVMDSWQAATHKTTPVRLMDAIGQVAAEYVVPYPPGIPVVVPGEKVSEEAVEYIERIRENGWEIRGLTDPAAQSIWVVTS